MTILFRISVGAQLCFRPAYTNFRPDEATRTAATVLCGGACPAALEADAADGGDSPASASPQSLGRRSSLRGKVHFSGAVG